MFAERTTNIELGVDTDTYRIATRFSNFHNLPELTGILSQVSDFHSINSRDGISEMEKHTDIYLPCEPALKGFLKTL